MKPRTKLQQEVFRLSRQLPHVEEKILDWAKVDVLDHFGFATKNRVICMDCGNRFSSELVRRKRAVCPHCGSKIKVKLSNKRKDQQHTNVAIALIVGEFQVIRNFEIHAYHNAGNETRYSIWEVLQHWILPDGRREVVGRYHNMGSSGWCGDMEIRKHYGGGTGGYYSRYKMEVYPDKYHPESVFKKEYRKYGIDRNLQGITFLNAISMIPDNPHAETLLKARQYELLSVYEDGKVNREWASVKICLRNKYKVKDARMWFDYIDLLRYFDKDLHNAHYVCPKDLHRAHDVLMRKKRRIIEQEEAERKKIRMLEDKEKFVALKGQFFGISFSDGEIEVHVIDNIEDVMKEGDELHHCVYTNRYHIKPNSLILSATVQGKRTETVEINLKELRVAQCRALQNGTSPYHERIIALVEKNIKLIRERMMSKNHDLQEKRKLTAAV